MLIAPATVLSYRECQFCRQFALNSIWSMEDRGLYRKREVCIIYSPPSAQCLPIAPSVALFQFPEPRRGCGLFFSSGALMTPRRFSIDTPMEPAAKFKIL